MQAVLRGHVDTVNAVKFFTSSSGQSPTILSGSVDKTVRIWSTSGKSLTAFKQSAVLTDHTNSINCIAVLPDSDVFASGSADATVKIWQLQTTGENLVAQLLQTISTNPRFFPLALALSGIGTEGCLILSVAGTKSFVKVYVAQKPDRFCFQATLTGHEGWVRSLAMAKENPKLDSDILLASASQDKYIRLWRIRRENKPKRSFKPEGSALESMEKSLSNKAHQLQVSQSSYSLTFEALLLGHDDWIYTVSWQASNKGLHLLSASADSSLAFWEAEVNSGVWVCTTRLGEISAQKGSTTATGSVGGFWIGLWSPSGETVVSLGRTGSWRLWNYDKGQNEWKQGIGLSGHTKSVTSIAWATDGSYLLSTGADQTTRLHAEWKRRSRKSWHEFGRPQIHGYDLNCIDSIGQCRFITGADEKSLRVFDEPRATADLLSSLCEIHPDPGQKMPDAANIPMLGLSNKALEHGNGKNPVIDGVLDSKEDMASSVPSKALNLEIPPSEDHLARHTLWPEIEKLYGHGYEICAVASSHDGTLTATSCRASSIDHAVIRLYTTKDWREVKPSLTAHSLTITCLRFSKDDRYLLSVGRDRQWVVFERNDLQLTQYILKHINQKGHSRMILGASWAPLEAGRVFATAGRDKNIKLWKMREEETQCVATIIASAAVTAIDIFPKPTKNALTVAAGTENSEIWLYVLVASTLDVQASFKLGFL